MTPSIFACGDCRLTVTIDSPDDDTTFSTLCDLIEAHSRRHEAQRIGGPCCGAPEHNRPGIDPRWKDVIQS
jgi:hypothetical protein